MARLVNLKTSEIKHFNVIEVLLGGMEKENKCIRVQSVCTPNKLFAGAGRLFV